VSVTLGGVFAHEITVRDDEGTPTNPASLTLTVVRGDGTTVDVSGAVTVEGTGVRAISYAPTVLGRSLLKWRTVTPTTALDVEFYVVAAASSPLVTLAEVKTYLGDAATRWTDPELQATLDAETAAQSRVCRTGPTYGKDLREALLRRVQRNLALRAIPLAVLDGGADSGATYLPRTDPEVRRLEAPFRRLIVG
jgi:hypothetical protein